MASAPGPLVAQLQADIAASEWKRAIQTATQIIDLVPAESQPTFRIMRIASYINLQDWRRVIAESSALLDMPELVFPRGAHPSFDSSHAAAVKFLIQAYQARDDTFAVLKYRELGGRIEQRLAMTRSPLTDFDAPAFPSLSARQAPSSSSSSPPPALASAARQTAVPSDAEAHEAQSPPSPSSPSSPSVAAPPRPRPVSQLPRDFAASLVSLVSATTAADTSVRGPSDGGDGDGDGDGGGSNSDGARRGGATAHRGDRRRVLQGKSARPPAPHASHGHEVALRDGVHADHAVDARTAHENLADRGVDDGDRGETAAGERSTAEGDAAMRTSTLQDPFEAAARSLNADAPSRSHADAIADADDAAADDDAADDDASRMAARPLAETSQTSVDADIDASAVSLARTMYVPSDLSRQASEDGDLDADPNPEANLNADADPRVDTRLQGEDDADFRSHEHEAAVAERSDDADAAVPAALSKPAGAAGAAAPSPSALRSPTKASTSPKRTTFKEPDPVDTIVLPAFPSQSSLSRASSIASQDIEELVSSIDSALTSTELASAPADETAAAAAAATAAAASAERASAATAPATTAPSSPPSSSPPAAIAAATSSAAAPAQSEDASSPRRRPVSRPAVVTTPASPASPVAGSGPASAARSPAPLSASLRSPAPASPSARSAHAFGATPHVTPSFALSTNRTPSSARPSALASPGPASAADLDADDVADDDAVDAEAAETDRLPTAAADASMAPPPPRRENTILTESMVAERLRLQGNDAFRQNRYKEAKTYYESALKVDPTNKLVLSNLCLVEIKLGNAVSASKAAEVLRRVAPHWNKTWYRSASAALLAKDADTSLQYAAQGLAMDPDNEEIQGLVQQISLSASSSQINLASGMDGATPAAETATAAPGSPAPASAAPTSAHATGAPGTPIVKTTPRLPTVQTAGLGGYDPAVLGMMMELRAMSHDLRKMLPLAPRPDSHVPTATIWDRAVAQSVAFTSFTRAIMKAVFPAAEPNDLPIDLDPALNLPPGVDDDTWLSYVLPSQPLVSAALLLKMMQTSPPHPSPASTSSASTSSSNSSNPPASGSPTSESVAGSKSESGKPPTQTPGHGWFVAWTFTLDPERVRDSALYSYATTSHIYAALVHPATARVVDFLADWNAVTHAADVDAPTSASSPTSRAARLALWRVLGMNERAHKATASSPAPPSPSQAATSLWYTSSNPSQLLDLLAKFPYAAPHDAASASQPPTSLIPRSAAPPHSAMPGGPPASARLIDPLDPEALAPPKSKAFLNVGKVGDWVSDAESSDADDADDADADADAAAAEDLHLTKTQRQHRARRRKVGAALRQRAGLHPGTTLGTAASPAAMDGVRAARSPSPGRSHGLSDFSDMDSEDDEVLAAAGLPPVQHGDEAARLAHDDALARRRMRKDIMQLEVNPADAVLTHETAADDDDDDDDNGAAAAHGADGAPSDARRRRPRERHVGSGVMDRWGERLQALAETVLADATPYYIQEIGMVVALFGVVVMVLFALEVWDLSAWQGRFAQYLPLARQDL
ncbi:hypothetical protein CXG81DRAFT_24133 [Caulochytrium protostelioides]|uniref:Uncharacterized protein n=1 Tax=Caulochytrium protostelioides TaxID=1555241 RepID=A0A4P9XCS1_9FUNG|nr:hypothetical protein CXG81DRAFT_24133 [Caulochytrium protostelioides]|eukprot:RKP03248.1 hypothetical protein CXG81DRAFT_24133 [Caulochytrium protostelioides]